MTGEEFTRWFLGAYFTFVAAFYTATILLKKHRQGASPVCRGGVGSEHRRIHRTFVLCRLAIWAICVVRVPFPAIDRWLVPIPPLWHGPVMVAGTAVLAVSFAAIIVLHRSMGGDWRSGIDTAGPSRLITSGAFAFSRNPMFLLIHAAQVGFFLALPTVFAWACLWIGLAAVQAQVRLEEAHLHHRFGPAYESYRAHTRRWL